MFDIYGCHFTYGDFDSSEYDLIIANMDTSRLSILQGEQSVNTLFSKKNNTYYITQVGYSDEPVSFEMEILTVNGTPIGESFLHEIERALFGRKTFAELRPFASYDFDVPVYINCLLTNAERIETTSGIVGYKINVITDSVMAWEDPTTETFTFSNTTSGAKTFSIILNTDLEDYTYPIVTFKMGSSGGDFTLYNATDDSSRLTSFVSVPANSQFKMDCAINYLPTTYYTMFSNRNFVRLLNGENNFVLSGNVTSITVTYQNRKFL